MNHPHRQVEVRNAVPTINSIYCVNGLINKIPTNFLVDSGAAVSVVRSNLVKDCPMTKQGGLAVGASGNPLDVVGQTVTTITLGRFTINHTFTVVNNLMIECLLGADFLEQHAAILDCGHNTLAIGRESKVVIPLTLQRHHAVSDASQATALTVRAQCDLDIPPRSVQLVTGVLNTPYTGSTILVEPVDSLPDTLCVARSLSTVHHNEIVMQVMNISPSSVKAFQGMTLGQATPEDRVFLVSNDQERTDAGAPCFDHLQLLDMPEHEKTRLITLLNEYCDVFAPAEGPNGHTTVIQHAISPSGLPIHQPLRRLSEALKDTVKSEVQRMLHQDVIRPSASPWSSPVVMVKKKDGSWRFCIDYRKLNAVTHRDAYPLPRIDVTLDSLVRCKYFTILDLASGYWQVAVEESDKQKTAFSTPQGHFEFNVMPFGLTNAPATFQRLMECVLSGLTYKQCLIYLDDIIVFSTTFDEHIERLTHVFQALRAAHLQLKLSKCTFMQKEVVYLGHIVSADGVKPDPRKVSAVLDSQAPSNVKELRHFFGLTNYYCKFISSYANIADPLYKLLKGNKKSFQWTTTCQQAFDALKAKLTTPPVLGYPDFTCPFVLHSDASHCAIGAVLSQRQNGQEIVISYWSRELTKPERNYSTIEREALAVVGAMKEFYPYLYGFHFQLVIDHNPLTSLKDLKDVGGHLARWMLYLQQFDFTFHHRPGKNHANADAMSRLHPIHPILPVLHQTIADLTALKAAQQTDDSLSQIITTLTQGNPVPPDVPPGLWHVFLQHGILCRPYQPSSSSTRHTQIVIPSTLIHSVLQQLHNQGGHLGVQKTLGKVKERYYWPGYESDVTSWIRECRHCQQRKPPSQAQQAPLGTINSDYPFEKLSWDIMGPLPLSSVGNRYISSDN